MNPTTETEQHHGPQGFLGLADRALTVLETALLAFAFTIMIIVMFGQGVLSGLMGFEWPWAEKLALNMMVLATGAGASVAVREQRHVAIDALVRLLPSRAQSALAAVVAALCVLVCLSFFDSAMAYVNLYHTELRQMDMRIIMFGARVSVPLWTTRLALPFTLGLLAARFSFACLEQILLTARARTEAAP